MKLITRVLLLVMAMLVMAGNAFAQTWTTNASSPAGLLSSLASSADGNKLVVTGPGSFFTSTNSGVTWTQIPASNNLNFVTVASSADGTKLIAGPANHFPGMPIYLSTNSGATWSTNNTPRAYGWFSVASSADGTKLVAVGQDTTGIVYTSGDSGNTWVSNSLPVTPPWFSVASSADGNKLVVVSSLAAQICITTNGGATWQQPISGPSANNYLNYVACSADGSMFVAAAYFLYQSKWSGAIYTSTNFGMTWTSNHVPNNLSWWSVASSADGTKLAAAGADEASDRGVVGISTDGGLTWTQEFVGTKAASFGTIVLSADGNRVFGIAGGGDAARPGPISTATWPPSSVLNLAPSPTNLTLAWTVPSTNFILQTSADLVSWSDVTNPPVLNPTNLQNQVTLPSSGNSGFFRLTMP